MQHTEANACTSRQPLLGFEHKVRMLAEVPVAAALLGPVVGFGAARAVTSHYAVMVDGISSLFVAGPPVVAALGEHVTKEELGGASIHGWLHGLCVFLAYRRRVPASLL